VVRFRQGQYYSNTVEASGGGAAAVAAMTDDEVFARLFAS
jgi:hypothetical protein